MKNVLLINPPWHKEKDNIWSGISSVNPPIGIASIASFLEGHAFKVAVLDMHALKMHARDPRGLPDIDRYAVIGITCTTPLIAAASEIVKIIRSIVPAHVKIILGGVHPTVAPDECLMIDGVDYVVRGEGELTFLEILQERDPENILGISRREDGRIVHNPARPYITKLDDLPLPAYHLLPVHAYRPTLGAFKQLPGIGIITSRGCPGRCTFCYRLFGSSLQFRSADHVMEEIRLLHKEYDIREIAFYDDTFTASKKRVIQICEMLLRENMGITWSCFARTDFVDQEMLFMMKKAGCHQIMYGFESASEKILQNINKRTDLHKVLEAIAWTKHAKIDIRAAFMLGSPGETEETLEETYRFAVKIDPEIVIFNVTTPYPGTEMFEWAKKNNYLLTEDWKQYDLAHPVMDLPTISHEKVKEAYNTMHRRFYIRPRYIFKQIKMITSWLQIKTALRTAFSVIVFK